MAKRRGQGAFVKVQKNKAYYKRFQVKNRRRREGKTNYGRRKKLIVQAKNKYSTPKYRLVVRKTNTQIICQITYATIAGDAVLASAYSTELPRYGLKYGLTNYAAAYCTGLLVGRRLLTKLDLQTKYGGDVGEEITGEIVSTEFNKRKYFVKELDEERHPFRVYLDVGLARTSLGARVFGALKGAADAGLDIPHSYKKFPGYDPEEKNYDASAHRETIFGGPVAEYMRFLEQEDEESGTKKLAEQFKGFVEAGIKADDLEELYASVHKKIREDPSPKYGFEKTKKVREESGELKDYKKEFGGQFANKKKESLEERKAKVQEKLKKIGELEGDQSEEEIDMGDDEGSKSE